MRQIILDTETTGLRTEDGHRIIEVGCLEMVNRRLTGERFHIYLNPEREIDAGAVAVHGLTNEFLKDKPVFHDVAKELVEFITGAELIIHNAPFDVSFLNYELRLANQGWQTISDYCSITDTLLLARQMHVGQRNSLDALCKRYGVDNTKRDLHGALLDAHLLAQVYLAMTGGQGSLFGGSQANNPAETAQNASTSSSAILNQHDLIVVKANAEELEQHNQYLTSLLKRGKCMWNV